MTEIRIHRQIITNKIQILNSTKIWWVLPSCLKKTGWRVTSHDKNGSCLPQTFYRAPKMPHFLKTLTVFEASFGNSVYLHGHVVAAAAYICFQICLLFSVEVHLSATYWERCQLTRASFSYFVLYIYVCVCVCVCREREREYLCFI